MKYHSFQELVRRIVHLSTRDGKPISISWTGKTAYTTTSIVNIPALPAGTTLTPSQFNIWLGYTIHEGPGHQTHSDLALYSSECKKRNNPIFSHLFNVFEDVRIENADILKYPGDRKYLDAVHQFIDDQIPADVCQNPDILGQIYKHVYVQYRSLDTHRISGTLSHPAIKSALTELPNCKSTLSCALLADKIISLLSKELQSNEPKPDPNSPNSNNKNNLSDDGSPTDSTSNGNSTNPNSNSSASNPDNSGNVSRPSPSPNHNFNWESLTEVKNIIEKLTEKIAEANGQPNPNAEKSPTQSGRSFFPPVDISKDRIFVPSSGDISTYTATRNSLAPQILSLKKMFRIYLQSRDQKSWLRGLEEGSLDRDRLHVAATGTSTIFKTRHSRPFINTAISLMLDLSSSMDSKLTRASAIILSEALATIPQIKIAICGFTTNEFAQRLTFGLDSNTGRATGMDIKLFKNFETPYIKSRARLGAIFTRGSTPLGDAYGKALEQLISRPEPRKIIFLLTDGQPEFHCGANHSDYLLMENIKRRAKKLNVETFGLGIGQNVKTFLPQYVENFSYIESIETLPQNLMQALKRII